MSCKAYEKFNDTVKFKSLKILLVLNLEIKSAQK